MAKAPSARISKTVGQGITRGAYQLGRRLSGVDATDLKAPQITRATPATGGGGVASGKRDYTKADKSSGMNIEYSEREMRNPNLKSLLQVGKLKAPRATKGFL